MKSLFGDDEPVSQKALHDQKQPKTVALEKQATPEPVYTIDDRLQELEDAIDVVAAYAISTPKERDKVIERAAKLLIRLNKIKGTK